MKKTVAAILSLVLFTIVTLCMTVGVSADSLYIRKIVSVVYDDSGSMDGDKSAYANYAMQAFCGMLNDEDQLFITYMSGAESQYNYSPAKMDLSADNIQNSIDSIRNHTDSGATPYASVEVAYDKLKSVKDTNPNTQYWLVVITDGAFNEHASESDIAKKQILNRDFGKYTSSTMPNGTNPQMTFLSISGAVAPDESPSKGIYTYSANNASEIVDAMSKMADKISGRTRVANNSIKKVNGNTIQVSSSIPLLNIAVFNQKSSAILEKAVYSNELNIPVTRTAVLNYPGYADLSGGAFLIGDSENVIGSGTYNITFNENIDLNDVIVLFEPALEVRMTIAVNGKEISDYSELDNVMENDKVSVSCKIYEMGTDTEVDPSLMPPGTKFEITVSEDEKVVEHVSGKDMLLSEYTLKNIDTEITAAVVIEGFNPIDYSARFTPTMYVPQVVYSITSGYGSNVKNVKFDNIAVNKDLSICFTVFADGVTITDPGAVKALNPVISVSPQGNNGTTSYSDDGKIVFTPNAASMPSSVEGSFDVDVTCTLSDGTAAKATYTVLIAEYQVVPVDTMNTIKKTGFFGNQVGVSFYITKDGRKLDKGEVENHISILLNEQHSELKTSTVVANDGTITITPYTDEEHTLTFWNWWINWAYYWGLEGDDVVVTLTHAFGTADSTINVVEEDLSYQILNVYIPFVIELIALALLVTWIVLVITKPRYLESATLYVGIIRYNQESNTHILRDFSAVRLSKFNKVKKGNGRLKFKRTADVVSANGIRIRADRGGRIICEMPFPWYKGRVEPVDTDFQLNTPSEVFEHMSRHKKLEINEFATTETVEGDYERALTPVNPRRGKYFVVPDSGNGVTVVGDKRVIKSGKLFIYINE